jgi:curved DNA-binding protein CbpA
MGKVISGRHLIAFDTHANLQQDENQKEKPVETAEQIVCLGKKKKQYIKDYEYYSPAIEPAQKKRDTKNAGEEKYRPAPADFNFFELFGGRIFEHYFHGKHPS